jgi:hypothetical protein
MISFHLIYFYTHCTNWSIFREHYFLFTLFSTLINDDIPSIFPYYSRLPEVGLRLSGVTPATPDCPFVSMVSLPRVRRAGTVRNQPYDIPRPVACHPNVILRHKSSSRVRRHTAANRREHHDHDCFGYDCSVRAGRSLQNSRLVDSSRRTSIEKVPFPKSMSEYGVSLVSGAIVRQRATRGSLVWRWVCHENATL